MARDILASSSPRRRELLGLVTDFDAIATPIEEDGRRPGEAPFAYARRLARRKAERALFDFPDRRVIAADTIVTIDDDILGKPHDAAGARSMLLRLRDGGAHQVITAVAVGTGRQTIDVRHETSEVAMRDYSDGEIERYVASGDPMDKAGAYAVQSTDFGPAASLRGCYLNVVGLPLCLVREMLDGAPAATGTRRAPDCGFCQPRLPAGLSTGI